MYSIIRCWYYSVPHWDWIHCVSFVTHWRNQKLIHQRVQASDGVCVQTETSRRNGNPGSCASNDLCRCFCITRDPVYHLCHCKFTIHQSLGIR
jgi:hypothetical protein